MEMQPIGPMIGKGWYKPNYITAIRRPGSKEHPYTKAEGGYLDTPWNELPISQRAEIMREAVNNGIYNLQDVRDAYHNNLFGGGGYIPSKAIKQRIAEWEGTSMYKAAPDTGKVNRSFEAEAKDFNRVIPASIRAKLSQDQLDALYSYGYNVGMGNLKTRVLPTLTNYINGNAGAEDVVSSMWASRDSDPKMGGLRRRRAYERNQSIYGSPSEKRQSVVTSALNMDLSNIPSGLSEEDLQQLYLANPTDYGTPVDYSTPTRPVVEAPIEEDYTQPSGMGIFNLMSNLGMFGSTKQEAPIASYTPTKNSNPYVVSMPTNNSTLLDASWFADGGHLFNDGGDTITDAASGNVYYGVEDVVSPNQLVVNPDGSVTTINGITGAVKLPATTITGYRNTDDRIKAALNNIVKENPAQISSIPSIALSATGDLIKGGANAVVNAFGLPAVAPASAPKEIKDGDALLDYISVVTPAAKANIFRPLTLLRSKTPLKEAENATSTSNIFRTLLDGTEIPLNIKAKAAKRYIEFIDSKDYLSRLEEARLADHWNYMKDLTDRRLNYADYFPGNVKLVIDDDPYIKGMSAIEPTSSNYGITLREGLPQGEIFPVLDHEVAHWATGNAGTKDFVNILKPPFRYDSNYNYIGDIMRYNESIAPTKEWDEVLQAIPKNTPIDEVMEEQARYNYLIDPQEIRARLYSVYQQAKDAGMSLESFVDKFTRNGEIIENAPDQLQDLGKIFTTDNLKKRLSKFLGISAPIGMGASTSNNN